MFGVHQVRCGTLLAYILGVRNLTALFQNRVHDTRDRRSRVDDDPTFGEIFFRCVQSHDELSFGGSSAPFGFRPLGKPSSQRAQIDFEHKDPIEQIDEFGKVPGAAAEE